MWFRTKQGVEYKVNDKFIGIKMTREEAEQKVSKACGIPLGMGNIVTALEALGLLKLEEKNKVYIETTNDKQGTIRLEQWSKGLVLWVDGEIVYRSWKT